MFNLSGKILWEYQFRSYKMDWWTKCGAHYLSFSTLLVLFDSANDIYKLYVTFHVLYYDNLAFSMEHVQINESANKNGRGN